jgi:hypothetical protein
MAARGDRGAALSRRETNTRDAEGAITVSEPIHPGLIVIE